MDLSIEHFTDAVLNYLDELEIYNVNANSENLCLTVRKSVSLI